MLTYRQYHCHTVEGGTKFNGQADTTCNYIFTSSTHPRSAAVSRLLQGHTPAIPTFTVLFNEPLPVNRTRPIVYRVRTDQDYEYFERGSCL
jgi:hypothetical protein